ncbi:LETM1 domain-containing protein 1 [Megachile rotundata]|uniref:LETM1 domain-containing protein 1 n=1 Tax=Megachile rotundata TaxID=143995 RepID=UPI003FD1F1A0
MIHKIIRQQHIFQNKTTLSFIHTSIQNQISWGKKNKKTEKSKVSNIKKYWFDRYINYIKNYEQVLEKKFPRTMHVYRVFSIGTKDLFKDVKEYLVILKKPTSSEAENLTVEQLRLTYTVPRDLIKLCPVLLISAAPFTNYIIFPLAYHFPKQLLTSHYWTLQQRLDFMLLDHKKRLKHNRPLFRCMQAELHRITNQKLKKQWNDIIACLGSGTHPQVENIIACSELFAGPPYSLNSLKRKHIKELLGIHDISSWTLFKQQKLIERGMLIKRMDQAIQKQGGSIKMPNDEIRWALSFRGVSPANMSIESMRNWLDQWFIMSNAVNEDTISLLLHSPILLAYNHPTNWILIYS